MDSGIEFSQSAFKHGITEENIRYAFAHPIVDFPVYFTQLWFTGK
jgi:hypothetical protein